MYEAGATVGYYAGQFRRRLTHNDLSTIERFIYAKETGPVYLVVARFQKYHPTVARLIEQEGSPYRPVLIIDDDRGRVVIYRVQ